MTFRIQTVIAMIGKFAIIVFWHDSCYEKGKTIRQVMIIMTMEQITMQLIVNSGDARSKAMEAIGIAKNGEISKARKYLEEAKEYLAKAHQFQTDMIQEEADGNVEKITMLMAHAQDHLMNAITVIDLAREFVDLYEKISKHEGKSKVL